MITMSCLGRKGRWGNQVFQYMFLRTYAKRCNTDYQCGKWIGQRLMGHEDPSISAYLPIMKERLSNPNDELATSFPPEGSAANGTDYNGYCQYHTSYYAQDKSFIKTLFQPIGPVRNRLEPVVDKLRSRGSTVIGLHMRRGDTGRLIYYLTPNSWYLDWLEKNWSAFENPVLFIASENPEDRVAFSKYNPVMSSDLLDLSNHPYPIYNYLLYDMTNPSPIAMDWFPDWWLLYNCDILLFGNSTFSFTAAMLGKARSAWRSRLSTQKFEPVDPWNSYPLVREDLRDYPGVANTWYDNNPKWIGGEVRRNK